MSVVPPYKATQEIKMFGHTIGNGPFNQIGMPSRRNPVLIIAEIGVNHNGSVEMAMQLISRVFETGADVVKFQLRDMNACYGELSRNHDRASAGLSTFLPIIQKTALSINELNELKIYADEIGIGFLVTPFDPPSVELLTGIGVQVFKVASCDAVNLFLLDAVIKTRKPFIVSTGMCTELEVFQTVAYLNENGAAGRFALMHAISSYPTAFEDCQLHFIPRYKHNFGIPVGWSGHERGVAVSVGAAALGADIIERHFTLDRTMPGPDQAASLEPDGFKKLVDRIRAFEKAYGNPIESRRIPRGEQACEEVMRKSLVLAKDVHAGDRLYGSVLSACGPGRGISPMMAMRAKNEVWNARLDMRAGHVLDRDDFEIVKEKVKA